jgi:deoxyribonuclease-4
MAMRVRAVLSTLNASERLALKKLLPPVAKIPGDLVTLGYPTAVLGCFPKEECYSLLGIVAEELLRQPVAEITQAALIQLLLRVCKAIPMAQIRKVRESVTTAPFLEALQATKGKLDALVRDGPVLYDQVVSVGAVEGHPDGKTAKQVIEVKLTGQLEKNGLDFLFQLSAYGALAPEAEEMLLVLPLQKEVLRWSLAGWKGREAYREFLAAAAQKVQSVSFEDRLVAALLVETWAIGSHVRKLRTLKETVSSLRDYSKPWQIFLGGPVNSKISAADADIAACADMVGKTGARLYVHSQYIINLCSVAEDDWNTQLLIKNVQIARAAGCRGVVVHVGKSVKTPLATALETMRRALQKAMEHASAECPVLLETPAGQGTETLTKQEEFIGFVEGFADSRLRMCVDTCHVFACGHTPLKYLEAMDGKRDLVRLIHYNDSAEPCGSCLDRHAAMGSGHIGLKGMRDIAEYCGARGWPMVIE